MWRFGFVVSSVVHWSHRLALSCAFVLASAAAARADWFFVDCRPGNPSGSQFTRISDAVAYLNGQRPALGTWDSIILRSDCTDNVSLTRSQVWIAPEWDWCPWSSCTTNGVPARITAANPGAAVIDVEGPHDILLAHLVLTGGSDGLAVGGGGSVTAYGVVAEGNGGDTTIGSGNGFSVARGSDLTLAEGSALNNRGHGIYLADGANLTLFGSQTWLQNKQSLISGNALDGLRLERANMIAWAGVTIEGNKGWGLRTQAAHTSLGGCCGTQAVVRGNGSGGAFLTEGSTANLWGGVTSFQDNGPYGIYLDAGSSVAFSATEQGGGVAVEGHTDVGVNVTTHGQASFVGHHVVRGNGTAMNPWSAGVRVDGSSNAYFDKDAIGVSSEVTQNGGPGILLDLGSVLDAPSASIDENLKEGVRVRHQSTAFLGAGAQLQPNGAGALSCDGTSLVVSRQLRRGPGCVNIEAPTEPRPARPNTLPQQ